MDTLTMDENEYVVVDKQLNWTPDETFATGIKKTIEWYLANGILCDRVKDGSYQGERLGVIKNG